MLDLSDKIDIEELVLKFRMYGRIKIKSILKEQGINVAFVNHGPYGKPYEFYERNVAIKAIQEFSVKLAKETRKRKK